MPLKLRIEYPGAIYHVMSRGDRREDIFLDDVDRREFERRMESRRLEETDPKSLTDQRDSGAYASGHIEEREHALAYLDGAGRTERFNTAPIEDIKGTMLWVDPFLVGVGRRRNTILRWTLTFRHDSPIVATASPAHDVALMKTRIRPGRLVIPLLIAHAAAGFAAQTISSPTKTVRIAAAQAARRVIDFRLKSEEALAALEKNLAELERIVDRAGEAKCDALVLPEDTPGLLNWVGANETPATEVLPKAVKRMLERLGSAAVRHRMYLVVCSDLTESEEEFTQANSLVGSGKTDEAISAFERLRKEYPATWIDRSSEERLAKLKTRGGV